MIVADHALLFDEKFRAKDSLWTTNIMVDWVDEIRLTLGFGPCLLLAERGLIYGSFVKEGESQGGKAVFDFDKNFP